MKLAVEDLDNNIGFFRIDGRRLTKFIKRAKKDIPNLSEIWSYEYIDREADEQIGVFVGIKKYYEKHP